MQAARDRPLELLRLGGRRRGATVPGPDAPARPDLIRRDFESPVLTVKLVGDITYLRAGEGWLCMAAVIGLCTRMVVGLSFSERMTADLPIAALEAAHGRGFVADGAIFHSDRGSQYTSRGCCNRRRPHPAIGYRIPAEVMDGFFARFEETLAREAQQPLAA